MDYNEHDRSADDEFTNKNTYNSKNTYFKTGKDMSENDDDPSL